jgi:hypothetical protein
LCTSFESTLEVLSEGWYVDKVLGLSSRSVVNIYSSALSLHSGNQDKKIATRPVQSSFMLYH